ncbi:MAG: phage late control D family protein [Armatimonadota bacterium]
MRRTVVDRQSNIVYSDSGAAIVMAPGVSTPDSYARDYQAHPGMINPARRAGARIIYKGVDITVDIAPWLLSVEFTDGIDKADDLQLTLWDDGRWRSSWAPDEGAILQTEIFVIEQDTTVRTPLRSFAIDEVEYSGPPNTVSIRATSAYVTTALRREKKTRAWEKTTLQEIAGSIARKSGLTLLYSARDNPTYQRIDQKSKSDMEFLKGLAEREGLRVKTSDNKLIIYSQNEHDTNDVVETFYWGDMRMVSYRFTSGITTAFNKCIVKYRQPNSKKVLEYTYIPPDAPKSGQTLRINERCESLADAERVAKNRHMAANRNIKDASIDIVGDVRMLAGQNIGMQGFGSKIDGRYAIEEARHALWPYTTSMGLRKI